MELFYQPFFKPGARFLNSRDACWLVRMKNSHKYLAEAVATFALVFIGAGAVVANAIFPNSVGLVGIALAHGLVLMSMIFATAHLSGAHVNPAVTLAMVATRRMSGREGLSYIVSQLAGAAVAGLLLQAIFVNAPLAIHLGTPDLASGFSWVSGILLEAILTFFLVFTIFGVAVDSRGSGNHAGLAIGLVLAFDILMGGNVTGAAMNPARAFGPALASGYWATHLVYWVGPIIGALAAAFLYTRIFLSSKH